MCVWIAPRRKLNAPICNLIRRSFARKTWDRFCALILWEGKRKRSSLGIRFQTDNGIVKQGGNIGQRFHTFLHLSIYITWTIFTIRIAGAHSRFHFVQSTVPQAITFILCAVGLLYKQLFSVQGLVLLFLHRCIIFHSFILTCMWLAVGWSLALFLMLA